MLFSGDSYVVDWYAQQHNDGTWPGLAALVNKQGDANCCRKETVNNDKIRIADSFVRPFQIWSPDPQPYDAEQCENIKYEYNENHIVQ